MYIPTSYYTDLYILLKAGYTRKSELCAGITLCKMASQNPHGTQSSTVCYCRIVYNATLPCQCNIGLLYFLNLYGNTPPLQPTLLDETTLFLLKLLTIRFTLTHSSAPFSSRSVLPHSILLCSPENEVGCLKKHSPGGFATLILIAE